MLLESIEQPPRRPNVPVAQARFMRTRSPRSTRLAYFEQPARSLVGQRMLRLPRMMEFFREQTSPPAAEQTFVDFTTANPAVSATCNWIASTLNKSSSSQHVASGRTRRPHVRRQHIECRRLAIDVSHLAGSRLTSHSTAKP